MRLSRVDVACGVVVGCLIIGCVALAYPEWSEARFRGRVRGLAEEAAREVGRGDHTGAMTSYSLLLRLYDEHGASEDPATLRYVGAARLQLPLMTELARAEHRQARERLRSRMEADAALERVGRGK